MNTLGKTGERGRAVGKRQGARARKPAVKRSQAKPKRATAPLLDRVTGFDQKRPTGKLGNMLDAVAAQHGASLDELVGLTGWQPHTARAALTRLRQRGFDVGLRDTDGRKAYYLAASP